MVMNVQNIVLSVIVPEKHKFPVKKTKYCDFRLVGQVLSPNVGQVLSLTSDFVHNS